MEEADKVSSSAPGDEPRDDVAANEAAAAGQTHADETLLDAEKTSPSQTAEETITQQVTEVISPPQTAEESKQVTEVTSPSQTADETQQVSEVTSLPQTVEETITQQVSEVTSLPQTVEETITQQVSEVTSSAQAAEESIESDKSEETPSTEELHTQQITEETSVSEVTEVTSAPQIADETPQSTVLTSRPEPELVVVPPAEAERAVEASPPRDEQQTEAAVRVTPEEAPPAPPSAVAADPPSSLSTERADWSSVSPLISGASAVLEEEEEEEESSSAPHTAHTQPERSVDPASEAREEQAEPPPAYEPEPPVAPALCQIPLPSDRFRSPLVADLTMDPLGQKDSAAFDPDLLSHSDDDFTLEMKKSPFQAFSAVSDSLGETTTGRRSVSDSPSPDLVQDAYDGEEGHAQAEEVEQDAGVDSAVSLSCASSDLFSNLNATSDERPMSLPDILKSSPLNPDKVDSGSSEGSPDFSPVHRSENDSPNSPLSASASSPFDSKILLLKEMVEETEARAAVKAKLEVENNSEQSFAAFDLLKETDGPAKNESLAKNKDGVEPELLNQTADRFECLHFPSGKAQEHWDSESPSADSFSPVLDAVTQKPSSFMAAQENTATREEIEATDEVSEQEASSEEFEFVERPPQGAADEFLEMQDSLTFFKPSEIALDEDRSTTQTDPAPATEDAQSQSSYHLLSQSSDQSSSVGGKAGLESDFQEISPEPVVEKTGGERKGAKVSDLSPAAVMYEPLVWRKAGAHPLTNTIPAVIMVEQHLLWDGQTVLDLLYWRDVKSSALVLGCSLFILLSLISCSIISILSYTALSLLSITISFRIYRGVLQAVQKSEEGHPFKLYLDRDVALSADVVQRYSDVFLRRINAALVELRRLFLVEDLVDSLKLAVLLWVLTYVGSWFNGLSLLILSLLGAFSGPIIYERHQSQIDQFISTVNNQIKDVLGKVQAIVPGAKKKSE